MPSLADLIYRLKGSPLNLLPAEQQGVGSGYGLLGAQLQQEQKSPYEQTLAPGEQRTPESLRDMLAGVIEAAGMAAVPGVGPHEMEVRAPGRVRPGAEKSFAEWFGNSKVVDPEGKPLEVYHGTNDQFSRFEHGRGSKKDSGWLGKGFYFASSPKMASDYTTLKGGDSPNVMPVHLKLENPLIVGHDAKEPLMLAQRRGDTDAAARRTAELMALGYDGVIQDYGAYAPGYREYVVFNPTQIKSATGNRGTYSRTSPDIRE